jgi:polysaccharide deacetylase family protein (PEP-CTERM system associated)
MLRAPSQEIVYGTSRRMNYRQLGERIGRAASAMASLGVQPGDTVAVMDWDSHRYLELARTERALAAAGAPRPIGFRASTFTLTRATWWAFEVLARRGYRYDSSVHPVHHPVYGVPDFEPGISVVPSPAGPVVEFPVATVRFLGRNLPVGGGGYFRLLPLALTRAAIAALERRGRPAALYLHPWEFDPGQPRQATSALKRFRHYLNLGRTLPRLDALLARFRFTSLQAVLEERGHLERAPT